MSNASPSPETQQEAMKIAKATQKPGQTKEQTKLIAQGIEKGIALYKKQQKAKARERDKERKKQRKQKQSIVGHDPNVTETEHASPTSRNLLPWVLLVLSWAGFAVFVLSNQ
ncbi:DUF2956 domain-containing protein [Grimontia hollisae]|uniref:Protein of uncharacterized function (DUF2956) n=1 Tax=Grimontia hollisae TaxID=673 RepID=A0A377HKF4_GRIHO|nr:DUF2956 domain-containing protein [Grimontia hollisae]MDF2183511.1 DUF2956 domain-containing protein [Grimontia hollisae]STO56710.1 Protein of uncharacterised function (DUF2956) [Grimontia hollisae]STQ74562.1 Protein of uncharacterised function (DUF2956) [Grimontia hollisae]